MEKQLIAYLILLVAISKNVAADEIDESVLGTQIKNMRRNINRLKKLFAVYENFLNRVADSSVSDMAECPDISEEPEELLTPTYSKLLSSCAHVKTNGVRQLYVPGSGVPPFYAYCMLDPNGNGSAWTVLLRRETGRYEFDRSFEDYQMGFGSVEAEHWIGLDPIHAMTYFQRHELWIHMKAKEKNDEMHLRYNIFAIDNEESGYLFNVLGRRVFYGVIPYDYLHDTVGQRFSSRSTDYTNSNCVSQFNRSWWMREYKGKDDSCSECYFTGPFPEMMCRTFKPLKGAIQYVVMAIRPTFV